MDYRKETAEVEKVRGLITEIVDPRQQSNINIIPEHITPLRGNKSKKQLSHRGDNNSKQKKTLTRKEYDKLGLYTLPKKSLKYEDMLPLHNLWKGYIKEHLNLNKGGEIPSVHQPGYDAFSKLLTKSDLHGAKIAVERSKCPNFVGISGLVVLDTKNTLQILGKDNKLRTVPKADCIFTIKLGSLVFTIFGKHLTIRPAERSVKKIKNYIEPEL